jgi:capsular polysaccharide transport system ATP-binding protein
MWGFVDCTRYFLSVGVPKVVLHDASMVADSSERVGLLIPPGQGKSTIIRLLAGVEKPDSGTVLRDDGGWPLGYSGSFQGELTGEQNVRNIALMVGLDPDEYALWCADFSELGEAFFYPVKLYSGSMRGRLAFAASLGIPATTYLVDDKLSVGDEQFRAKCENALARKLRDTGLILVASNPRTTQEVCERHGVVIRGKIIECDSHEEAEELFVRTFRDGGGSEDIADEELASFDLD